jgi:hypothetical protein
VRGVDLFLCRYPAGGHDQPEGTIARGQAAHGPRVDRRQAGRLVSLRHRNQDLQRAVRLQKPAKPGKDAGFSLEQTS